MTVADAVKKIKTLQQAALTQVANVALSHVMPFVPINVGTLQKSGHVEVKDASVDVVFGAKGSGAEEYVAYQYSKAERHVIDGSSLGKILEAVPSSALSGVKGEKDGTRYATAYRYAVENNLLTRFPGGARWFRFLMGDDIVKRRMAQVYANYLSASTNSSGVAA